MQNILKSHFVTVALALVFGFIGAATWSLTGLADARTKTYLLDNPQILPQMAEAFQAQQSEVQALLEAPFSTFLKEETIKKKTLHINQFTLKDVPHYEVKEKVIWGATAMIMSELVEVARQPAMR